MGHVTADCGCRLSHGRHPCTDMPPNSAAAKGRVCAVPTSMQLGMRAKIHTLSTCWFFAPTDVKLAIHCGAAGERSPAYWPFTAVFVCTAIAVLLLWSCIDSLAVFCASASSCYMRACVPHTSLDQCVAMSVLHTSVTRHGITCGVVFTRDLFHTKFVRKLIEDTTVTCRGFTTPHSCVRSRSVVAATSPGLLHS